MFVCCIPSLEPLIVLECVHDNLLSSQNMVPMVVCRLASVVGECVAEGAKTPRQLQPGWR